MSRKGDLDVTAAPWGRWQQLAIALGGMLGAGWLITIPQTGRQDGWVVALWLVGAAATGLIAIVVVQLAQADQRPGGLAFWSGDSSGKLVGAILNAGLLVVYAGNPASNSATAVAAFSSAFSWPLCRSRMGGDVCAQGSGLDGRGYAVALCVMTVLFLIHLIGLRLMLRLNITLSALKALALVVFLLFAVLISVGLLHHPLGQVPEPAQEHTSLPINLLVINIMFAYGGFQGPVDHGAPQGKQHRGFAIYGALIIATLLYLLLQLTFTAADWVAPSSGLRIVVAGLLPLTNALLFVSLAGIVLRISAEQRILRLPWLDTRVTWQVFAVVYVFGVLYMLLTLQSWAAIVESKLVISVFVYSYAAIAYTARRRTRNFKDASYLGRRLRGLAPLSFMVASAVAFYAGFPSLLWAYLLMFVVALLMLLSRGWSSTDLREQLRRGRWLLQYFGVLFLLTAVHYSVLVFAAGPADGKHDLFRLYFGLENPSQLPTWPPGWTPFTVSLMLLAAVFGLVFYRIGVRESVSYMEFRGRTGQ